MRHTQSRPAREGQNTPRNTATGASVREGARAGVPAMTIRTGTNRTERDAQHHIHGNACGLTHVFFTAFFLPFVSRRPAAADIAFAPRPLSPPGHLTA